MHPGRLRAPLKAAKLCPTRVEFVRNADKCPALAPALLSGEEMDHATGPPPDESSA